MKTIDKLTEQQEKDLVEYYEHCLKVGRSIEPIKHDVVEEIITKFYKMVDKDKPDFIYCQSPMDCAIKIDDILNKRKKPTKVKDINEMKVDEATIELMNQCRFCGQQWISWSSFYTFAEKIGVEYTKENSDLLKDWVREGENLHWWFPFDDVVFVVERPIRLTVNETGNLHNESVMAIEYPDGYGFYFLNGVAVPKYLVETPSEDLSIDFFKKEKNADVKAEFVRKFGVERMLDLGTKKDSYENYDQEENPWWWKSEYELWDMKELFPGLDYQPFVKMRNQTTGIWHVEAVSPACLNLADAIKERFGGKDMRIVSIA